MTRRSRPPGLLISFLAYGVVGMLAEATLADTPGGSAGMPTQAQVDLASTDPGANGAGWGDMPGGVSARPYVVSLSVTNGGVTTPLITGGTTAPPPVVDGGVTAVVAPFNLCRSGQTPAPGVCYATPNRVGITVGYNHGPSDYWDFSNPVTPLTPTIDSNSVIDMTIALNTLGQSLRWTWVNGELLNWQATDLGQPDATVELRFRPAVAPYVSPTNYPAGNGCTATPPMNCEIAQADGQVLAADLVFSLDDTLDAALTGTAFATQNAIFGYLAPGGTASAPSLDVELASTHLEANGSPTLGTVQAFIPAAALINYYGVLPDDSSIVFSTTREGNPGSNDAPTYVPWTTNANGSDGLLITVDGVTFSTPGYQITAAFTHLTTSARSRRGRTTIHAFTTSGCSAKRVCIEYVYDLGAQGQARYVGATTLVATRRFKRARAAALTVRASKLTAGARYMVVVRDAKSRNLIASGLGRVG